MSAASFSAEVGRGLQRHELPAYAPMLDAYQRAFAPELRSIIAALPLVPGSRVLDLACGAGAYSRWLAERLGRDGQVVGADLAPAFLDRARRGPHDPAWAQLEFVEADATHLTFDDGSFDLSFCAQSLYSLPDPQAVLVEMARVTRPGGAVVVLENDLVHQLVLPWPVDLELAVRTAQVEHLRATEPERADRFFVGRSLGTLFEQAGLPSYEIRSYSLDRTAPLRRAEEVYLREYLRDLAERVRPRLAAPDRERFDALADPRSERFLLYRPGFHMTLLNQMAIGSSFPRASIV